MKRIFTFQGLIIFIFACIAFQSLHAQEEVKWRVFHSPEGAYSVEMPREPKYMYRVDSTEDADGDTIGIKTQMYLAEGKYGAAYFVAYYSYPPGFIITNPREGFSNMASILAERMGGALAELEETEHDGYIAADFLIRLLNGLAYRGQLIVRSGRIYLVMAGANDQMLYDDEIERFFTSFRFKEFIFLPKQEYSFAQYGFSAKFPAEPVIDTSDADFSTVQALDTSSAVSYMVIVSPLNEYFETEHPDSVLGSMYAIPEYMRDDTLLSVKKTTFGGYPAHEVEKMTRGTGQAYRFLYVLRDDVIYTFFVFLPRNMLRMAPVNEFFTSVKFLPRTSQHDIYSRKAGLILKDIASSDTLRQQKALGAFGNYEFRESELPQLYAALRASYPDDTLEYGSTREIILEKFTEISDSTTVPAIGDAFKTFPVKAYSLKRNTLQTLRSMNSRQSLELLTELIVKEDLPSQEYDYAIYNKWNDSLNNYRYMFPKILGVFKKDTIGSGFYVLLSTALDSNIITAEAIRPHLGRFLKDIDRNMEIMQRDAATKDSAGSGYYHAANTLTTQTEVLGRFAGDQAAFERLEKLLKTDFPYLNVSSVKALLKAGKSVPSSVLKSLAADSGMRLALYRTLEEIGATDKFPQEYYTQRAMALSNLYEWLNEGETYSEKIEYMDEFEVSSGKTEGRYFLYKYMVRDEEGAEVWYTAISGPQPLDKTKVSSEGKRTNSNWKKIDEMSPEEHFKTMLEETLKWDEE